MRPAIPALALSLIVACGHGAPEAYGQVLERGGELGGAELDERTLIIRDTTVSALGVIEVPDGARLQAAYAGADALARAELLKLVRVRIEDEMVSVDSTDPARRGARERTVESVSGSLRHVARFERGFQRVRRGERVIVRIWSRLSVPRSELDAALAAAQGAMPIR